MADTYTLISSVTVGAGGASSIDFTSIPATYTDLQLVLSGRSDRVNSIDAMYLRFNGETNDTNNSQRYLEGNGASASSGTGIPNILMPAASSTASTFGNLTFYISNYAGSSQKSISIDGVTETNGSTAYADLIAYKWTGTAAINQITLTAFSTNKFVQYSTAYLYGIKNS